MFLNEYGEIAKSWWHKITERYEGIALDEYIVMPNHFHGIVSIETTELNQKPIVGAIHELPLHESIRQERRLMLLLMLIGCFKMNTSKHINHLRKTPGCPVWQRNYYERIIRDETELGNIRKYVLENPAKWMDDKYYRLP